MVYPITLSIWLNWLANIGSIKWKSQVFLKKKLKIYFLQVGIIKIEGVKFDYNSFFSIPAKSFGVNDGILLKLPLQE